MIDEGMYIGKEIHHKKFGNGTVQSIDENNRIFVVEFEENVKKNFMLSRDSLSRMVFMDEQLQSAFSELINFLDPVPENIPKHEKAAESKLTFNSETAAKVTSTEKIKAENSNTLDEQLQANYQAIYSSLFEHKNIARIDHCVDQSNRDAWLSLSRLAKAKMPEAIFELCAFHRKAALELCSKLIPATILPLFGVPCGEQIKACGLYDLYLRDGKEDFLKYKTQWRAEREKAFSGTADGFYDENTTWRYIETYILPIATRDIWDSLNEFYNGEFAMTPPDDQRAFTSRYQEYCKQQEKDDLGTNSKRPQNGKKRSLTFDEAKQLTDHLIKEQALDELLKAYLHLNACDQTHILYRALAVVMSIRQQDDSTGKLVKESKEFIQKASAEVISKTLTKLEFSEKKKISQYLVNCPEVLNDNWLCSFKSEFEASVGNNAENGWWVHILDTLDALEIGYSNNLDFWLDQKLSAIDQLICTFQSCMLPQHFLEFARKICFYLQDNFPDSQRIYNRWKRATIAYLLTQGDTESTMRQFRNLAEVFCSDPQEMQSVMEDIFSLAASKISNLSSHSTHSDSDMKTKQFTSAIREIEELEINVMQQILAQTGETGANYDQLKHLDNLRNNLAFFVEHNWGKKLEAVVSDIVFESCQTVEYNAELHNSNEDVEDGQRVHVLSRGFQIDNAIVYKARVTAKYVKQEETAK